MHSDGDHHGRSPVAVAANSDDGMHKSGRRSRAGNNMNGNRVLFRDLTVCSRPRTTEGDTGIRISHVERLAEEQVCNIQGVVTISEGPHSNGTNERLHNGRENPNNAFMSDHGSEMHTVVFRNLLPL